MRGVSAGQLDGMRGLVPLGDLTVKALDCGPAKHAKERQTSNVAPLGKARGNMLRRAFARVSVCPAARDT